MRLSVHQKLFSKSVFAACLLLPTVAFSASCNSPYGMASTADRDAFKLNPQGILTSNPEGGGVLARSTRELLLADTDLNQTILTLAPTASEQQQSAMGVGLGQATMACGRTNPQVAQQISLAVLTKAPKSVVDAFKATMKDVETLAITNSTGAPAAPGLAGSDANGNSGGPEGSYAPVPQKGGSFGVSRSASARGSSTGGTSGGEQVASLAGGGGSTGGSSGGGNSPNVPTVPGPTVGEGPLSLLALGAAWYLFQRRRAGRKGMNAA